MGNSVWSPCAASNPMRMPFDGKQLVRSIELCPNLTSIAFHLTASRMSTFLSHCSKNFLNWAAASGAVVASAAAEKWLGRISAHTTFRCVGEKCLF